MCIFIHTYFRMNIFARMCTCTRAASHTHTWFFIHVHTHRYIQVHPCVYAHTHTCPFVTHIYLCVRSYACARPKCCHAQYLSLMACSASPYTQSWLSRSSELDSTPPANLGEDDVRKQWMTEIYSKSAHAGPYPATPAPILKTIVEAHSFHPPPRLCPQILEWQRTGTKKAESTRLLRKRCGAKCCWGLAVPYPSQAHCAIERPWLPEMTPRGTWRHSRWMMRENMRGI